MSNKVEASQLKLPLKIALEDITVSEVREVPDKFIENAKVSLKRALADNFKLHSVSSSVIKAMRSVHGGNWLCNIRDKNKQ